MRKLICLFIAVSFALSPAIGARATENDPSHPLFSDASGWTSARSGGRVSVAVARKPWLRAGIDYWNSLAGWNLFVFGDDPQITAHVDQQCRYCALVTDPYAQWSQPFVRCNVSVARDGRDEVTIAHELGHCLGLEHQRSGVMRPQPGGAIPPRYRAFDQKLLVTAGYSSVEAT